MIGYCELYLLPTVLVVFSVFLTTSLLSASVANASLPEKICHVPPFCRWTSQEKKAWKEICIGKVADLTVYDMSPGDLSHTERWSKRRTLRSSFIETILLHDPWRSAIPPHGVTIRGAIIQKPLNLEWATIKSLQFLLSQIEAINLEGAHIEGFFTLDNVRIKTALNLSQIRTDGSLDITNSSEIDELMLRSAKIGGDLDIGERSKVNNHLWADKIKVNGSFYLDKLIVSCSDQPEEPCMEFRGANIDGQISLDDIVIEKGAKIDAHSTKVGAQLLIRDARLDDADFSYMWIGGNVDFSGSQLKTINLNGTQIVKDLILGTLNKCPPTWSDNAQLNLRNVSIFALQDREGTAKDKVCPTDAWPKSIDTHGFKFQQLGSISEFSSNPILERTAEWWQKWISRGRKSKTDFRIEPYLVIANVLRNLGQVAKADDLLFLGKQAEQEAEWDADHFYNYSALFLRRWLVGYGLNVWLCIFWIMVIVVFGAWVIKKQAGKVTDKFTDKVKVDYKNMRTVTIKRNWKEKVSGWADLVVFSFDMLLPIIKLNERNYEVELDGRVKYYYYFHRLLGWLLGYLLITGLAEVAKYK